MKKKKKTGIRKYNKRKEEENNHNKPSLEWKKHRKHAKKINSRSSRKI